MINFENYIYFIVFYIIKHPSPHHAKKYTIAIPSSYLNIKRLIRYSYNTYSTSILLYHHFYLVFDTRLYKHVMKNVMKNVIEK